MALDAETLGSPPTLHISCSETDAPATIGSLGDGEPIEGTKYRAWRAPFTVRIDAKAPGVRTGVVRITTLPGKDFGTLDVGWKVKSEWTVEPRTLVLDASQTEGRIRLAPRKVGLTSRPVVRGTRALNVAVEDKPPAFEVVVRRTQRSAKSLELLIVTVGRETFPLSVVLLHPQANVGGAKP